MPWEISDGLSEIEIDVGSAAGSPFVPGAELMVVSADPAFYYSKQQDTMVIAAHSDFSAVISAENPATPGEVVHLYATGLGSVVPAVVSGFPAPLGPLSGLAPRLVCTGTSGPNSNSADILFAGLAPGMLGVYQVDLRVQLTAFSRYDLTCTVDAPLPIGAIGSPARGYLPVRVSQ